MDVILVYFYSLSFDSRTSLVRLFLIMSFVFSAYCGDGRVLLSGGLHVGISLAFGRSLRVGVSLSFDGGRRHFVRPSVILLMYSVFSCYI